MANAATKPIPAQYSVHFRRIMPKADSLTVEASGPLTRAQNTSRTQGAFILRQCAGAGK